MDTTLYRETMSSHSVLLMQSPSANRSHNHVLACIPTRGDSPIYRMGNSVSRIPVHSSVLLQLLVCFFRPDNSQELEPRKFPRALARAGLFAGLVSLHAYCWRGNG